MGWIAFFSPAQSEFNKEKSQESFLTESSGFYLGYGLVSERNSVSEIPTFKVDWTQDGKINSTWSTEFVRYHRLIGSEFWTAGSAPLFDVKILFQQYFYPW
ncbi:hypothetical protein SAMN04487988_103264 [Algoriphagus hitonicola]|uniref:Uncharacterized protein n=2 Tax=Algoriphagus hitonicola TaxID=435880 RepID=A0A1I2RI57_9BACT|nr:hypothetical protein SAMN04487988_103264 [Algoriphagus hitonicola]